MFHSPVTRSWAISEKQGYRYHCLVSGVVTLVSFTQGFAPVTFNTIVITVTVDDGKMMPTCGTRMQKHYFGACLLTKPTGDTRTMIAAPWVHVISLAAFVASGRAKRAAVFFLIMRCISASICLGIWLGMWPYHLRHFATHSKEPIENWMPFWHIPTYHALAEGQRRDTGRTTRWINFHVGSKHPIWGHGPLVQNAKKTWKNYESHKTWAMRGQPLDSSFALILCNALSGSKSLVEACIKMRRPRVSVSTPLAVTP